MRIPRNISKGFTLLEILIAVAILAIGLVSVFSLFPVGIYAVKETVDNTRGTMLAASARSELSAMRADMRLLDGGSQSYAGSGYVPFGPWRFPGSIAVFRAPLYEYVNAGNIQRMVTFDDRKYVPISLTSAPNGFDGTNIVTVRQSDLTRDSDRLEYFYDAALNTYAPYGIVLRVQGSAYLIINRTYSAALPSGELATLTVQGALPNIPGEVRFDVLLPVAAKDPPIDVPLEWDGGVADFTVPVPPYTYSVDSANYGNRDLDIHFCEPGADPGGWISVAGEWCQVSSITRAAGMPTDFTVIPPAPTAWPPATLSATEKFQLLLPLVAFDGIANPDGTETLRIVDCSAGSGAVGGGGPQLGFLDAGAHIEIVLDGARARFVVSNPAGPTVAVMIAASINPTTSGFIAQGNFLRVGGQDYEIQSVAGNNITLRGAVPQLDEKHFTIVLGYRPAVAGQAPRPARFPVRNVTRGFVGTGNPRVTAFDVGPDANGNLPMAFFNDAGAAYPFSNPVHVLPRNNSQFSYEVVFSQNALAGDFALGSSNVNGPSWALAPDTPQMQPIPYPTTSLDPNVVGVSPSLFSMRVLAEAASGGNYWSYDIGGVSQDVNNAYSIINLGGGANFSRTRVPFHAYDRNDFVMAQDIPVTAGEDATFTAATSRVTFNNAPSAAAIFLAADPLALGGTYVTLTWGGGPRTYYQVASVDTTLNFFTIFDTLGGGVFPPDGSLVSVAITQTDAASASAHNYPRGRGVFTQGSDTVTAVYPDQAGLFAGVPGRGFPYSMSATVRYELAVGDYIQGPDLRWYAVKAINDTLDTAVPPNPAASWDFIVLDRAYEGATTADHFFQYVTPISETYEAQIATFRNYRIRALRDGNGSRALAASFGYDSTGAIDPLKLHVQLAAALPQAYKAGDYIRADGDANHPSPAPTDFGLGDAVDGDWRWYMIDTISADRLDITLTSPYRGYIPAAQTWQPASATNTIVKTYDTIFGAF